MAPRLCEVFSRDCLIFDAESRDRRSLFEELAGFLASARQGLVDASELLRALEEREATMSTLILPDVAFPHARVSGVANSVGAIAISRNRIEYPGLGDKGIRLAFLIVSPLVDENSNHVKILKRLALCFAEPSFKDKLLAAESAEEAYKVFVERESSLGIE